MSSLELPLTMCVGVKGSTTYIFVNGIPESPNKQTLIPRFFKDSWWFQQIHRMILMIPHNSCVSQKIPPEILGFFMFTQGFLNMAARMEGMVFVSVFALTFAALTWFVRWRAGSPKYYYSLCYILCEDMYAAHCLARDDTPSHWMLIWYKRSINHHSNATTTHCSYSQVTFATPAVDLAKNMYLKNLHVLIITRSWALDAGHCWLYIFNYTGYVMSVSVSAVELLECIKRILFCMTQTTQCYLAWITCVPEYVPLYIYWLYSIVYFMSFVSIMINVHSFESRNNV